MLRLRALLQLLHILLHLGRLALVLQAKRLVLHLLGLGLVLKQGRHGSRGAERRVGGGGGGGSSLGVLLLNPGASAPAL